ncbi:MAG: heavy-metal-associated domain-containing protein [Butyricicoccus sp.]
MANIVIVAIIVVLVIVAIRPAIKHMKGEGGCCGGGGGTIAVKPKKLDGKKIAEKIVYIEGMHCENCKNAVERQINRIDGAAAQVDLKHNLAVVSMNRMVEDDELRRAVEMADFQVTKITLREV